VVSVTPRPHLTPGQTTPSAHWTGDWVSELAGLFTEARGKILCGEEMKQCHKTTTDVKYVMQIRYRPTLKKVSENTDIAKAFFTPHHLDRCCIVIRGSFLLFASFLD
jgi:hypothetical protein